MSESTFWIQATTIHPEPAIPGVKPSIVAMPILALSSLFKWQPKDSLDSIQRISVALIKKVQCGT